MKKLVVLLSCMLLSSLVSGMDMDTKQTMKAMKTAYIKTMRAKEMAQFSASLTELDELLAHAKTLRFPQEKKALFLQGLNKVSVVVDDAQIKANDGQMQQAKEMLKQVDHLREEYHDQRNESIWKRFFG
ncbi:MAG: cytochrome b562 family protein [Pseudomonadales bacterium]|nr:cytochrome b562 family protein [Pseudomonadales bacterium]